MVEVQRWHRRPVLGALLRGAAFVIPFGVASAAVAVAGALYAPPTGSFGSGASLLRIAVLLCVGVGAAMLAERAVRPLFPLASLLQMSLLFPDRAPSRLLTALRAGATRNAKDLLEDPAADGDQRDAASRILVLVSALGHHDRITRGHCERVRTYADLMATRLELSPYDADRLRWAALLHDIGKLRVAYATLNKKGKLDVDEWEAIKRHPADGAALIAPMAEWLGSWADAVPQHHERVDGKGYPLGLSGDQIHRGARIIAVIDAFDVMTASRSYKRPISSAAARAELQRCAGTQFDPVLVEAFLDLPEHRAGWWAGAIAALLQVPGLTNVARIPGRIVSATAQIPVGASATLSTVAVGAASLALVAGVAGTPAPEVGGSPAGVARVVTTMSRAFPAATPSSDPGAAGGATSTPGPAIPATGGTTRDATGPASPQVGAGQGSGSGPDPATTTTTRPASSGQDGGDGSEDGNSGKSGNSGKGDSGNGNGNSGKGNSGNGNSGNGGNGGPSGD